MKNRFIYLVLFWSVIATPALGVDVVINEAWPWFLNITSTTGAPPVDPIPEFASSVLWWEFANTNDPTDDSSYIGTNVGAVASITWVEGSNTISPHYTFANNGEITASASSDLDLSTVGTWSIWVNRDLADDRAFISKWTSAVGTRSYVFYQDSDTSISLAINESDDNEVMATATVSAPAYAAGKWHHFAAKADGTNLSLYRMGEPVGTPVAYDGSIDVNSSVVTYCGRLRSDDTLWRWDGELDEPIIYNSALTDTDINTLFWTQATNFGWSTFDYDNRSQWSNTVFVGNFPYDFPADTSYASTNNGTKGAGAASPTWIGGSTNGNGCYSFDGGDYIQVSHNSDFSSTSKVSLAVWMYGEDTSVRDSAVIGKWGTALEDKKWSIAFEDRAGGTERELVFLLHQSDNSDIRAYSTNWYTDGGTGTLDGVWNHITMVADGSNMNIYVNGQFETSTNYDGTIKTMSSAMTIGKLRPDDAVYSYMGLADEVRIWPEYALSATQVSNLYTSTTNGHPQ